MAALLEEMKFVFKCFEKFGKKAVVAHKEWIEKNEDVKDPGATSVGVIANQGSARVVILYTNIDLIGQMLPTLRPSKE
ncbi:STAS/SEC14 domain-containing protein [Nostocaceae cyanobacterium CENA357]|uniref:STAS/SEC14 domain-containing protein n=1 Tax=Atlanticothrix silvestris CENA357 TaxID=1725252 RepID=A0A8J7L279_9CYAN|nr:hypothetical protein [Atlanticothrix silvestris]MBH8551522.1 STAS/SEC14 domain-containing protein [Atlanticothrix silvestris CENA357]